MSRYMKQNSGLVREVVLAVSDRDPAQFNTTGRCTKGPSISAQSVLRVTPDPILYPPTDAAYIYSWREDSVDIVRRR